MQPKETKETKQANAVEATGIEVNEIKETKTPKDEKIRKIGITETSLRDGHQSLIATRLKIADVEPILETMDEAGYYAAEVWGGATFDSSMRFLDEDPWERLRIIRKHMKKTKLMMLLRGQNLVGYRNYADDTAKEFVKRAAGNGIDIFRIFDALNDLRNLECTTEQALKEGAHVQLCMAYTTSPVHSVEAFAKTAVQMKEMGAHSICIKDMAGLLTPVEAQNLVKGIKSYVDLPIEIHSHYTCGLASMAYWAAIEAGADIIDCACTPLSMRTAQPSTEVFVAALQGKYDTGMNLDQLLPIVDFFKKIAGNYNDIMVRMDTADIEILKAQVPGGMYSNMVNQLKELNAIDKLQDVLDEIPRVRKAMGYPPLVTPTSQIVGTQATLNVISGKPFKNVSKEVRAYFEGYYGKSPAPMDPEVTKMVIGDKKPITQRPADLIEPELEKALPEVQGIMTQPEDLLSYVLFPNVAKDFLAKKFARETKTDLGFNPIIDDAAYPV